MQIVQICPNDLIELQKVDPTIILDIKYATADNVVGFPFYNSPKCFLRLDVAKGLACVQKELRTKGLGLKIWDAYRPFSAQEVLWKKFPDENFVAKPVKKDGRLIQGSKHSRGAAVDLTMVNDQGIELDMPSYFDEFGPSAHRMYRGSSLVQQENLMLLESTMEKYGFEGLQTEWWHYNWQDWEKYELIDFIF